MKIKIIKTKNFILRPYRLNDAPAIAKILNNRRVSRWLESVFYPYKLEDAKKRINRAIRENKKSQPKTIILVIEIDGQPSGVIGFSNIVHGHMLELGYWLKPAYWGKGIMSEVIKTACYYAFREFKIRRIQAEIFVGNIGSEKVLLKNGFVHEGLKRKSARKNNRFFDCNMFAKIR